MPLIERDGSTIHYETLPSEQADAETLVFIPGLSATTRSFPTLFEELTQRFHIVALDPRGAGQTRLASKRFRLRDVADDVVAVMDALQLERPHVLGLSMGGMIAQELVLAHPERVSDLVLCCTMCGEKPGRRPGLRVVGHLIRGILGARANGRSAEAIAARFGPLLFAPQTPEAVRVHFFRPRSGSNAPTKSGLVAQLLAIRAFGTYRRLGNVQHRTLVIHGDEDILVPPVNAQVLHDSIPNAELALLPGGHVFFHEHPELFLSSLDRFFADSGRSSHEIE
jgi:pimeloyl-ACP methyl ester carboxylesterase